MNALQESHIAEDAIQYVTVTIGGHLFGIPISVVHDVFVPENLAAVPLSGPEVAGLLNLRGRIVTAIDMRVRLGLDCSDTSQLMAVGIERRGESYGLLVDAVGEVLLLPSWTRESNPTNIDANWAKISTGIHRLDNRLMIVLNVEKLLAEIIASANKT